MKSLQIVLKYMEIFFSGENFDRLQTIFANDLYFEGPLFIFHTAEEYIQAIVKDPPQNCTYKMIEILEKENLINLIYEFHKNGVSTKMSQLFEIENQKIKKIILIFDSQKFIK